MTFDPKFISQAIEFAHLGPHSSNPRVGAVCVKDGIVVGTGVHRGAGTPHAEVEALAAAGTATQNADLYVSLEPCSHIGRTPACTQSIIEAGISRVFYAQDDPTSEAGGGAGLLRNAGLEVAGGFDSALSVALNREWNHRMFTGMPFVTWKFAQSLDGRVAAAIGLRTVISGSESRGFVHELRSRVGAIMVGTETFLVDSPSLVAREVDGSAKTNQPLRVVMGMRDVAPKEFLHLATRDPEVALAELAERGVNHLLLEGGPTLAAAFVESGWVNEIISITAPVTLGSGPRALATNSPLMGRVKVTSTFVLGADLIQIGELG
ncbi:MAG: bifunctional diaminohydroxyphosphoribosylaminopyrimidine deaminase/5-amino-6-(5-phosphoribosylamino)uracil reductase RibD [Candidatus Nanopelagicales bacterium]|nr:bifunctional diaminohydroxyphosphoribosylaminopyrimidine deaminase/5-amino-6-(5-phosphoribosylamino)uracil reductase RibD [Candidatus Nanopelagicales bacterium]